MKSVLLRTVVRVQLLGEGHRPRFAAVKYGDHLESKVLSNFELDDVPVAVGAA